MPSKELYIGNINPDTKTQEIREIFQLYGNINRCDMKFGNLTHSAAFGFVGFESSNDAERAQQQENGRSLHGRRLIVEFTKTKPGQNLKYDRFIGLEHMNNRNNNEQDRSKSHHRNSSYDRYRRPRSSPYNCRSTRDRRKRDRSRSLSNHKSNSKRLHLSPSNDKRGTVHSHKNGNSRKR